MKTKNEKQSLLHWVNTLPVFSCLLVQSFADLTDGEVLWDIVLYMVNRNRSKEWKRIHDRVLALHTSNLMLKVQKFMEFIHESSIGSNVGSEGMYWSANDMKLTNADSISILLASFQYLLKNESKMLHGKSAKMMKSSSLEKLEKQLVELKKYSVQTDNIIQRKVMSCMRNSIVGLSSNEFERRSRVNKKNSCMRNVPKWNSSTKCTIKSKHVRDIKNTSNALKWTNKNVRIDARGLTMSTLWDPTFNKVGEATNSSKPRTITKKQESRIELARDTCMWIKKLGFSLDFQYASGLQPVEILSIGANLFTDGVMLCKITAYIVHRFSGTSASRTQLRQSASSTHCLTLHGCTSVPSNQAQKHHNIALALKSLRKLPNISTKFMYSVRDILNGDPAAIWGLLDDLRKYCSITKPCRLPDKFTVRPISMKKEVARKVRNTKSAVPHDHQKVPNLPYVTDEQIRVVAGWLKRLGFEQTWKNGEITLDKLRNGILLCQLLELLDAKCKGLCYHRKPKSIHMARENVNVALNELGRLHDGQIPEGYYTQVESILQGNRQITWGLLWNIMQLYPISHFHSLKIRTKHVSSKREMEKHTAETEQSLLTWLIEIDAFENYGLYEPIAMEDALSLVANGVLLCRLASRLGGVTISDVITTPITETQSIRNIRKALSVFRRQKSMPSRFLWHEHEVACGNKTFLLGLLSDIRLAIQGKIITPQHQPENFSLNTAKQCNVTEVKNDGDSLESPFLLDIPARIWYNTPEPSPNVLQSPKPTLIGDIVPQEVKVDVASKVDIFSLSECNSDRIDLRAKAFKYSNGPCTPPKPLPRMQALLPHFQQPKAKGLGKAILKKQQYSHPMLKWLNSINVKIESPESFVDPKLPLHEFRNGVLLCKIVERVEHMRKLEGICQKPLAKASCLHNIRKAMNLLQQKKKMPLRYLHQEQLVFDGDRQTIFGILHHMMKVCAIVVEKLALTI